MYTGCSLQHERQYRRAEEMFQQALQFRKSTSAAATKLNFGTPDATVTVVVDPFSDAEIRYRLAQCLEATHQFVEAATVLQAISSKLRPAKVNMLLSRLLQHNGYDKTAIAPLKAVLRECPMNLDAMKGLLALGVKVADIYLIISDCKCISIMEMQEDRVLFWIFIFSKSIDSMLGLAGQLSGRIRLHVCM